MTNVHAINVVAAQLNATLQRSIRDQRTYVETLAQQAVRDGHVHGFIDLASSGEIVATVTFPISFMEKPVFSFGLEMGDNQHLNYGDFPICSAVIASWVTQEPGDSTLYVGAQLGIVVVGVARSILHYKFEGRSYTTPVGTEQNVSGPL